MPTETIPTAATELVDETPKELQVIVQENSLQPATAQSLQSSFAPIFQKARSVIDQSRSIVVTDASQKLEMKMARACRLELKALRVASDKTRKELKDESLRTGRAIDAFHSILLHLTETEEKRLQAQEDFVEQQEAQRKATLVLERSKILTGIQVDPTLYSLGDMSEETFQQLVEGTRLARAAEVERQRKAEAERIERETKEAAERERIRLENERLKQAEIDRIAAENAKNTRREKLHALRLESIRTLIESGDESHNAQYGHLTDDQYAEVVAGAKNRRDDRLKAEAEQSRLKKEAADKAAAEKAERFRRHDLHCTRMAILGAEELLTVREVQDADFAELYGTQTEEYFATIRDNLRARKVEQAKAAAEAAESARKLKALEAEAAAQREREAKERAELEAKVKRERELAAKKHAEELKAAQLQAEKENQARRDAEAKIKAASEAAMSKRLQEEEAARKLAAAPDKDRLLNYANAILALEIPTLSTPEAMAILNTVRVSRNKFVAWIEEKANAL